MEFLRFGGRFSGVGVGCCAVDIIQGFGVNPDGPASIQLVDGDSGTPCVVNKEQAFVGPTHLDVFKQRLRLGTFYHKEMPNHAFLAIITENQLTGYNENAKRWLAILKEHGFEFIRSVRNSVYHNANPPVHIFGLFRNIGEGALENPFMPPAAWTALPECTLTQQQVWDRDETRLMTEAEIRAAGAPVILAGTRGLQPRPKSVEETITIQEDDEGDYDLYDDADDLYMPDLEDDNDVLDFLDQHMPE